MLFRPSRPMLLFWVLCGVPAMAAAAGEPAPDIAESEIVVVGVGDPFRLTYKQLRDGLLAFHSGRPGFAPNSKLTFQVRARDLKGVELALKSDSQTIPVALDADGRFVLPELGNEDRLALVTNQPRPTIAISPVVLSPGSDLAHRRLGDLRLQCKIALALERSELSIVAVSALAAIGGCASKRFGYYAGAGNRPVSAGVVRYGGIERPLQIASGRSYRAPLADKDIPDDAQVELTFR